MYICMYVWAEQDHAKVTSGLTGFILCVSHSSAIVPNVLLVRIIAAWGVCIHADYSLKLLGLKNLPVSRLNSEMSYKTHTTEYSTWNAHSLVF